MGSRGARPRAARGAPRLYPPDDASRYIPAADSQVYERVIAQAQMTEVPFAIGGGLAMLFYSGLWRTTKDIDVYVTPARREEMIQATRAAGLRDLHDERPYDRNWIYRAGGQGVIVDVIWALANGFGEVDDAWLKRGPEVRLFERNVALLAPAEMVWTKLHVLQRDRCDWPDLLNLLYTNGPELDWSGLIDRLSGEEALLSGLLMTFSWLAPARAAQLPPMVWEQLRLPVPIPAAALDTRVERLDSRHWFTGARID